MARAVDLGRHEVIRHRQRPDPVVDGTRYLFDRPSIGIDRVPNAEEMDIDLDSRVRIDGDAAQLPTGADQGIAAGPKRRDRTTRNIETPAIGAIGIVSATRQGSFVEGIFD